MGVTGLTFSSEHDRQLALRLRWDRCKACYAPVFSVAEHDIACRYVCRLKSDDAFLRALRQLTEYDISVKREGISERAVPGDSRLSTYSVPDMERQQPPKVCHEVGGRLPVIDRSRTQVKGRTTRESNKPQISVLHDELLVKNVRTEQRIEEHSPSDGYCGRVWCNAEGKRRVSVMQHEVDVNDAAAPTISKV